jgi:hypothetical protein
MLFTAQFGQRPKIVSKHLPLAVNAIFDHPRHHVLEVRRRTTLHSYADLNAS